MPFRFRKLAVPFVATVLIVACGDVQRVAVDGQARPVSAVVRPATASVKIDRPPVALVRATIVQRAADVDLVERTDLVNRTALVNATAAKTAEAAKSAVRANRGAAFVPSPPPSAPSVAGSPCPPAIEAILVRYFGSVLDWAHRIIRRESNCRPDAVNWGEGCDSSGRTNSRATGIWQMCSPMHEATFAAVGCSGRYTDAECNIKAAAALYAGSGRGPWGG